MATANWPMQRRLAAGTIRSSQRALKKPRFCRGLRITAISRNYPKWRGQDSNLRPRGYEPRELPGCSTPRHYSEYTTLIRPGASVGIYPRYAHTISPKAPLARRLAAGENLVTRKGTRIGSAIGTRHPTANTFGTSRDEQRNSIEMAALISDLRTAATRTSLRATLRTATIGRETGGQPVDLAVASARCSPTQPARATALPCPVEMTLLE